MAMNAFTALFTTYYHEIKFALFFSGLNLIWMLGEKLAGLHDVHIADHAFYTNYFAIPSILLYAVAIYQKQTELGGEMNFKQGFMSGLAITMIVTALTPAIQFIIHTVITPDYFANVRAFAIKQGMKTEIAENHFTLNSYIMLSVFSGFVYGIITTIFTTIMVRYIRMKR
jgi:hypothetical protein